MAAPCGAVREWAIWSVSMTEAPRAANRSATVVLPQPMPPVRPTLNRACAVFIIHSRLRQPDRRRVSGGP
jgi:hypothetical protein